MFIQLVELQFLLMGHLGGCIHFNDVNEVFSFRCRGRQLDFLHSAHDGCASDSALPIDCSEVANLRTHNTLAKIAVNLGFDALILPKQTWGK